VHTCITFCTATIISLNLALQLFVLYLSPFLGWQRYTVDSNVKKLSKGTTKRRRQKAFPLTFGPFSAALVPNLLPQLPPSLSKGCMHAHVYVHVSLSHARTQNASLLVSPISPPHSHDPLSQCNYSLPRPFPPIGERPRADEKERRLRANVEKKLVGDRVLSASAMKVLMMRAGPAFKTEDVRTGGGGGASDGDSDLEDLIDDLM